MNINIDTLDYFYSITGYDITTFFKDATTFFDKQQKDIINYYSNQTKVPNIISFNELQRLITESSKLEEQFTIHRNVFLTGDYFFLQDYFLELQEALFTTDNASKWLRSTITKNSFNPQVEKEFLLRQNTSLESFSDEIGYSDRQQDWVQVALRNDLREEDYTNEGGNLLKASFQSNLTISINSIVDNPLGQQIYGLDIDKKLTFVNNDLKVLSYQPTFRQTVQILLCLVKGDVPEFPDDGVRTSVVAGSNINAIYYPSIFRQLYGVFEKDDTIKSIAVTNLVLDASNNVNLEVEVTSMINETVEEIYVI